MASKKQALIDQERLMRETRERMNRPLAAIPIDTAMAADEVLTAASHVEHAYSVGGGWSVPLSLNLRRLQTCVRNLRDLEARDR